MRMMQMQMRMRMRVCEIMGLEPHWRRPYHRSCLGAHAIGLPYKADTSLNVGTYVREIAAV